ncbi:hypothetical protein DL546_008066 [Coniochaeta pulveracea]|uniref:Uncharacterized protein n=1 Tax=Coniochaeta pulveracea TaxID=177199 RepID=A0A420YHU1_9PEZI|nr:hypothetical protein DL546_008066 [Coniochaeta pulveracea]
MLTISKPVHYGYRSIHDLPTPPICAIRPPSPLGYPEPRKAVPSSIKRSTSPPTRSMSGPHRGLPPPAGMTYGPPLPHHGHQGSGAPPAPLPPAPPPGGPSLSSGPPPQPPHLPQQPQQTQLYGQIPAPQSWHHVSEESMRAYLLVATEAERRRQEEEKTRQAALQLEQRKLEHDILKASLQGGIPPPMVPIVFAGIGAGTVSQAAFEWAQQYVLAQYQQGQAPALLPPGQVPALPRRDSQHVHGHGQYAGSAGVPSTPGSAQGPPSGYVSTYPSSPGRPRGQSNPTSWRQPPFGQGHPQLHSLNTAFPGRGVEGPQTHPGVASGQRPEQQQESAPPLFFHHWQPPTGTGQSTGGGKGSGTELPVSPSGESPRKRKATGPQQAAPAPSSTNPFAYTPGHAQQSARRRGHGHTRNRSDASGGYSSRGASRPRAETVGSYGTSSVPFSFPSGPATIHEAPEASSSSSQQQQPPQQPQPQRGGGHTVSSLLSDNPPSPQASQYPPARHPDTGFHHQEGRRSAEELRHTGGGETTVRDRGGDNE